MKKKRKNRTSYGKIITLFHKNKKKKNQMKNRIKFKKEKFLLLKQR